jgi:hypothetical protein
LPKRFLQRHARAKVVSERRESIRLDFSEVEFTSILHQHAGF